MAALDEFIPCLILRKNRFYRHFIHQDDIESLDDASNRTGKLKYYGLCQGIAEPGREHAQVAYGIWMRVANRCYKDNQRFGTLPTFVKRIKQWLRCPSDYTEVIIMKFVSATKPSEAPLFIGPSDPILNELKEFLSEPLKNWSAEFCEDEFKPKDNAGLAVDSDREDNEDIDDESDNSDESDDDDV
jgi:hypothetical protein